MKRADIEWHLLSFLARQTNCVEPWSRSPYKIHLGTYTNTCYVYTKFQTKSPPWRVGRSVNYFIKGLYSKHVSIGQANTCHAFSIQIIIIIKKFFLEFLRQGMQQPPVETWGSTGSANLKTFANFDESWTFLIESIQKYFQFWEINDLKSSSIL